MKRVHLLISGEVTGVGFRFYTVRIARELGLTGWIRNLPAGRQVLNGRVEIVAEGEKGKLENLITWAHQGPPLANVKKVDVEWGETRGDFTGFEVRK